MSKPVVFVIGASGYVGTYTVSNLSAKYADKVEIRAGVRNPEKADKLKALPNVTVVKATQGDSNLVDVFAGVSTLYIITPGPENRAQLAISTAESAKQAGVKHIAVVSVTTADLTTDFIIGSQFAEIESAVAKLGVPYTFVRLPYFMENYFRLKDSIVGQGVIYSPADPDKPYQTVSTEDAGKASAEILAHPEKYVNKTIYIISHRETYNDFAKAISEVLGREIKYIQIPYEAARKTLQESGVPEWQVKASFEFLKLIDNSAPSVAGNKEGDFRSITGEEPTDLKQWVAKHVGDFQ